MLYFEGDVVKSYYFWFDPVSKQKQGIIRPVIVKEIKDGNYVIVKISRTEREGLIRIKVKSKEWREMGLYDESKDSFVDKKAIQLITESEIQRKIGDCPQSIFELLFDE